MGAYEKVLGLFIVPTLYIVLLLLAIGIARRQVHKIVSLLLKFNFKFNSKSLSSSGIAISNELLTYCERFGLSAAANSVFNSIIVLIYNY